LLSISQSGRGVAAHRLVIHLPPFRGITMSVQNTAATAKPIIVGQASKSLQAIIAICLGLIIVGFVGFSHIDVVHNAAHDTRHANGFPCH
jgi:cobalt transporter subunit CbtB